MFRDSAERLQIFEEHFWEFPFHLRLLTYEHPQTNLTLELRPLLPTQRHQRDLEILEHKPLPVLESIMARQMPLKSTPTF